MAARFQYPERFGKSPHLVGNQVHYAVAHHYIGEIIRQGHFLNIAIDKLYIAVVQCFGIFPGAVNHSGGHVEANHAACFAGFGAGHKTIVSGPGAEVEHHIAGPNLGKLGG